MAGSRKEVTVGTVVYASRSDAAKALVESGKTLTETVNILNEAGAGMTYQTVYAVTKGAEKVKVRRAKYRILTLGKAGKKSAGEIAKRCGVSTSKVVSILRKAGIATVTAKAKPEAKPVAEPKVVEPVAETVEPVAEATADTSAKEAALADIAEDSAK